MAVPAYLESAIKNEIKGYNLSSDKEALIFERVKGTLTATYDFDSNFRATLNSATPEDREKIIRSFLRDYIKKEINLETTNIERQLNRVSDFSFGNTNGKSFKFSDLNPLSVKDKTTNKKGERNFKPYEDLRGRVLDEYLPNEENVSKEDFDSSYKKDIEQVTKDYNDRKITYAEAQNRISDLNNSVSGGLGVEIFDEDFGGVIDHRMALIKQRVEGEVSEGRLRFNNQAEKMNLYNELYAGNTSLVDNHINPKSFKSAKELNKFKEALARAHTEVTHDTREDKMSVAGDGIFEFHQNNLKNYESLIPKNSEGAYSTLIQGNVVSSITELSYLAERTTDTALKSKAQGLIARYNVVNDLLNINASVNFGGGLSTSGVAAVSSATDRVSKAIFSGNVEFKDEDEKHGLLNALHIKNGNVGISHLTDRFDHTESIGGLKFTGAAERNAFIASLGTADRGISEIRTLVENAESAGQLSFASSAEREKFINSFKEPKKGFINNFVQPSFFGNGTFSKIIGNLNEDSLDFAGESGISGMGSRAINFYNNLNKLNRQHLNNFIFMAQKIGDSGYAINEIKKNIKNDIKKYWGIDTDITIKGILEKRREKSLKSFIDFVNDTLYKNSDKKKLAKEDFDNLKEIHNDFRGYVKKWAKSKFTEGLTKFFQNSKFLKKYGLDFKFNKDILNGLSLAVIKKSKYGRLATLAAEKYSRYLLQALKLGLKKVPYAGPLISKLASRYFPTKYLGKTSNSLINAFISAGGKIGTGGNLIEKAARMVIIGCSAWVVLFVILVLSIMLLVLGAFSSNSGTPYLPGSYSEVTFGTFESFDQNLAFKGGRITSSGNVCVVPGTGNTFSADRANWNNLNLSDFEGTDNNNNCKIMCNARQVMAGLQPGRDGGLNCNYNYPDLYNYDSPTRSGQTQFWCTQLIMKSYRDDDPSIDVASNALVITMDSYLKRNSDKYERVDLAEPNNPNETATLSNYNSLCVGKENFQSGNIVIFRNNTCNDSGGSSYRTYNGNGELVNTSSAHVEMVLKLSGDTLYTISSNNLLKKLSYRVSSSGCPTGKVKVVSQTKGYVGSVLTPMYLCRMYQKRQTGSFTCETGCDIPPNNYPDIR